MAVSDTTAHTIQVNELSKAELQYQTQPWEEVALFLGKKLRIFSGPGHPLEIVSKLRQSYNDVLSKRSFMLGMEVVSDKIYKKSHGTEAFIK